MSVSGIEAVGFSPYVAPTVAPPATSGVQGAAGGGREFGDMVIDGIERLEGVQDHADRLAVQAATGDLSDIHDYTLAATEADVTTKLTVAVRNKALEAFTEIMRMQVG
ncbi:flagellar hook-basal body complex protein FliE [Nocardioides euryhalodurans]|uniref:Flagellar hook-basal body complex protein FliE n=1 Tax=Nocardioides euryhalodurans TaxID=2518370 RepID=A0A4P7GKQ3_9ACTN|nr:flagellar hook-basal body complex protein FliE [Nocardioides euryhalodurans]QBR92369.1 flagellar hook-basal body complex protein FliE [Nocardioides euryhalodurans]